MMIEEKLEKKFEKKFLTIIVRKLAKQGKDYHFSIPRDHIGLFEEKKQYELRIYELNEIPENIF